MTGRCRDCHYWIRPRNPADYGICLAVSGRHPHARATTMIYPKRKRGQHAEFQTLADYGCVEYLEQQPGPWTLPRLVPVTKEDE